MNKHIGKAAKSMATQAFLFLVAATVLIMGASVAWDGICLLMQDGWFTADLWFLGFCVLTGLIYGLVRIVKRHRDIVDTE